MITVAPDRDSSDSTDSRDDDIGSDAVSAGGDWAGRPPHEALEVETVVTEERGRWAVDIVVVFADGVVRKRIDTHHTKARAELSARLIKRAAERELRGPLNG